MGLEREIAKYEAIKQTLIDRGDEGKFVVIRGEDVLDVFSAYEDALRQGLKAYGDVEFLIKCIEPIENVNHFFHGVCVQCPA